MMNFAGFNSAMGLGDMSQMHMHQSNPFTNIDMNAMHDQDDDGAKIEGVKKEGGSDLDKKKRGMSRLRMRRAGKGGKLTKNGLDMQSFYKTKICPYLLAVIF